MGRDRRPSPQTLALLAELAADPATWRHGYDLSRRTGIPSGTLYPILMRLSDRGYLEARWSEGVEGRPPRHLYRLTASGLSYAATSPASDATPALHRPRLEGAG